MASTSDGSNCVDLDNYLDTEINRYKIAISNLDITNNLTPDRFTFAKNLNREYKKLLEVKSVVPSINRYKKTLILLQRDIARTKADRRKKACGPGKVYIKNSHYVTGYESDCVDLNKFRDDYRENALNMYTYLFRRGVATKEDYPVNAMTNLYLLDDETIIGYIKNYMRNVSTPINIAPRILNSMNVSVYKDGVQKPWFISKT